MIYKHNKLLNHRACSPYTDNAKSKARQKLTIRSWSDTFTVVQTTYPWYTRSCKEHTHTDILVRAKRL